MANRYDKNEFPPVPAGTVLRGWGSPYALVLRGARTPGKRPGTSLAYIVYAKGSDGGRKLTMRAMIRRGDTWTKPRPLDVQDVVKYWRNPPAPHTLARLRGSLARVPA